MPTLVAGAAARDISPKDSQFLFGYPNVKRYSSGVHDPLLSSALYLSDGQTELMFISNDVIFVGKETVRRARAAIQEKTGIPAQNIMISATHTHSGPLTVDCVSNAGDQVVPKTDPAYIRFFEEGIVAAALAAHAAARPAEVGLVVADGSGVGTNRRDPVNGPSDPQVPVLVVRAGDGIIACMLVYSMHPTVLHEDSRLVSADFPGMARQYLQTYLLGADCPVLYHTGPAGNQSVRYVTTANSFPEAERLGSMLGQAVASVLTSVRCTSAVKLSARQAFVDLPRRKLPPMADAKAQAERAARTLAELRQAGAPKQQVRKAEVDWFGAEETVTLARAAEQGLMEAAYQSCLPAEVQVLTVGPWSFVAWPGEIFIEYALEVKAQSEDTYVISLANGELQGYISTASAAPFGGYETTNAIFAPGAGSVLVDATLELLDGRR